MKIKSDYYTLAGIMVIMVLFFILALRIEFFAVKWIPLLLTGTIFILCIISLLRDITAANKEMISDTGAETSITVDVRKNRKIYLIVGALLVGFYLVLYWFGFFIVIPLFMLAATKIGGTRWWISAIMTILVIAFIYGLFGVVLKIDLYQGAVFLR